MRRDSLLNLFILWRNGATILAGTAAPAAQTAPAGPRVVRTCGQCPTWCIGADQAEALHRLATHRHRCHPPHHH